MSIARIVAGVAVGFLMLLMVVAFFNFLVSFMGGLHG